MRRTFIFIPPTSDVLDDNPYGDPGNGQPFGEENLVIGQRYIVVWNVTIDDPNFDSGNPQYVSGRWGTAQAAGLIPIDFLLTGPNGDLTYVGSSITYRSGLGTSSVGFVVAERPGFGNRAASGGTFISVINAPQIQSIELYIDSFGQPDHGAGPVARL